MGKERVVGERGLSMENEIVIINKTQVIKRMLKDIEPMIDKIEERSRKQGALEELEKLLGRLKIGGFIDKEHLWELIEDRIKELEGEVK